MIENTWYISLFVFIGVSCAVYFLALFWNRYGSDVDERLEQLPKASLKEDRQARQHEQEPGKAPLIAWLQRLIPNQESEKAEYQMRLYQAGIYSSSALATFFAVKLILMIAPPLIAIAGVQFGFFDGPRTIFTGCIAGVVGMLLPSFWLDRQIRRRMQLLRCAVPDMLDLMVICMESGLSAQGTMQRVSDELVVAHPVLAREMNIVVRDMELGASIDGALKRFADRSGDDNVRTLSTFMREARRYGTTLSHALRTQADSMRLQREHLAEEQAQKAAVKILLPTLLLIFPAIFVVLVGPAYIQIQEAFSK